MKSDLKIESLCPYLTNESILTNLELFVEITHSASYSCLLYTVFIPHEFQFFWNDSLLLPFINWGDLEKKHIYDKFYF